ncbi:HK97 family phage prohead protease [Paludisphaera sp.]|uniref:HK97 family phage prohead protease n=1 Tax=Paludisphaera sp. TaxID=2017432 RepID=UPI00301E3C7B
MSTRPQPDTRSLPAAELRVDQVDGKGRIVGYAAVFDSFSNDLGGFREVIRPGAFAAAIAGADVRLVVNHDPSLILGRTRNGTLRLAEDSRGLRVEADPPDTQMARDYMALIDRGDLSEMSFRFYMHEDPDRGQLWRSGPDGVIREITEFARIDDVSIVAYPAYRATEVSVRSLDGARRAAASVDPWAFRAEVELMIAAAD